MSRMSAPRRPSPRRRDGGRDRVGAVGRRLRAGRRRRTNPGVTLRMPITNVRAPQRERRAGRSGSARAVVDGRSGHRALGGSRGERVAQVRVVDEDAPGPPRQDRASRPRRSGPPASRAPARGPRPGRARPSPAAARRHARGPARGELGRRASPGAGPPRSRRSVAPASASARRSAAMTPSTSLSAIEAVTSVIGPSAEERPQVVEGHRQGGGAGRVVGAVEQDVARRPTVEQLEAAGPARARVAAPARVGVGAWRCRPPRARRAPRRRPRRWRPGAGRAARPGWRRARGSSTTMPSRSQPSSGAGPTTRRAARRAVARGAG